MSDIAINLCKGCFVEFKIQKLPNNNTYLFLLQSEFKCWTFTCNRVYLHCCIGIFTQVKYNTFFTTGSQNCMCGSLSFNVQ